MYTDTSPCTIITVVSSVGVDRICEYNGKGKVTFGTNWPQLTWKQCGECERQSFRKDGLRENGLEGLMGRNAEESSNWIRSQKSRLRCEATDLGKNDATQCEARDVSPFYAGNVSKSRTI